MEEALELGRYLPKSLANPELHYTEFLWKAFTDNYEEDRYEFSSLAFHLLYMSYVSFSVWQIRQARSGDFKNALIGFQAEVENKLLCATSPFQFYDSLKESQIFRFLKIIGCRNEEVGEFAKFVRRRNKIAHPSGSIFFNDRSKFDSEVISIMAEVKKIQNHMTPIILNIYEKFLVESYDQEKREYLDTKDQIHVILIRTHYFSQKDIEICLAFNPSPLILMKCDDHNTDAMVAIKALHEEFREKYEE